MSWLTPERKAQFMQMQLARQEQENTATIAYANKLTENDLNAPAKLLLDSSVGGENGHIILENQVEPTLVRDISVNAFNLQKGALDNDLKISDLTLRHQSSGNIAGINYQPGGERRRKLSTSSVAVHLNHQRGDAAQFVGHRTQQNVDVSAKMNVKSRITSHINTTEKTPEASKTTVSKTARPVSVVEKKKRPQKKQTTVARAIKITKQPESTAFLSTNGTYLPPNQTPIKTTKAQVLRDEKIKNEQESKTEVTNISSTVSRLSGQSLREGSSITERHKETFDYAARIMNSRTSSNRAKSPATYSHSAAERYRQFVATTKTLAQSKRTNAKRRMVQKKMDDVFRKLSEGLSPEIPDQVPKAKLCITRRPLQLPASSQNAPKPKQEHAESSNLLPARLHRQQAQGFGDQIAEKPKKNLTPRRPNLGSLRTEKKTSIKTAPKLQHTALKTKKKTRRIAKKTKNPPTDILAGSDPETLLSDFTELSVNSSALSFPTISHTTTTSASVENPVKPKKHRSTRVISKKVNATRMLRNKPKEQPVSEKPIKPAERTAIAFGRAIPTPSTPQKSTAKFKDDNPTGTNLQLKSKTTASVLKEASIKTKIVFQPAVEKPASKKIPESSDNEDSEDATSAEQSGNVELDVSEFTEADTTETDSETESDYESQETDVPLRSADEVVKSLAQTWNASMSFATQVRVSNSSTSTAVGDNLQRTRKRSNGESDKESSQVLKSEMTRGIRSEESPRAAETSPSLVESSHNAIATHKNGRSFADSDELDLTKTEAYDMILKFEKARDSDHLYQKSEFIAKSCNTESSDLPLQQPNLVNSPRDTQYQQVFEQYKDFRSTQPFHFLQELSAKAYSSSFWTEISTNTSMILLKRIIATTLTTNADMLQAVEKTMMLIIARIKDVMLVPEKPVACQSALKMLRDYTITVQERAVYLVGPLMSTVIHISLETEFRDTIDDLIDISGQLFPFSFAYSYLLTPSQQQSSSEAYPAACNYYFHRWVLARARGWSGKNKDGYIKELEMIDHVLPNIFDDNVHIRTYCTMILHKWIKWQGTDDLMISAQIKALNQEDFEKFQKFCRRLKSHRGPICPPEFYDKPCCFDKLQINKPL